MKFSRSPAWVMPGKPRSQSMPSHPAPGAYQVTNFTKPGRPSWKIGQTGKCSYLKINDTPGPGSYNSVLRPSSSYGIINKPKQQIKKSQQQKQKVGPGAYNPNYLVTKQLGSSFSMKGKLPVKYENQTPGPGQYESKSTLTKNLTHIGTNQRQWIKIDKNQPGPGQYEPNQIQTKAKGVSLGKEIRCQSAKPSTHLGPGQYENFSIFQSQAKKSKGFTFSSKPPPDHESIVPGPGAYEGKPYSGKRPTSALINKAKRFEQKQNQIPGPGAYDQRNYDLTSSKTSPSWTYGKQIRQKTTVNDSPGPGLYNVPSYLSLHPSK